MATMTASFSRQYAKLCDRLDFEDPVISSRIRDIVPGLEPEAELHRKYWEYALLSLFLADAGKLDDDTQALAVGAGHETVLFWLANRLGRLVATDIYGEGSFPRDARQIQRCSTIPLASPPIPTGRTG